MIVIQNYTKRWYFFSPLMSHSGSGGVNIHDLIAVGLSIDLLAPNQEGNVRGQVAFSEPLLLFKSVSSSTSSAGGTLVPKENATN